MQMGSQIHKSLEIWREHPRVMLRIKPPLMRRFLKQTKPMSCTHAFIWNHKDWGTHSKDFISECVGYKRSSNNRVQPWIHKNISYENERDLLVDSWVTINISVCVDLCLMQIHFCKGPSRLSKRDQRLCSVWLTSNVRDASICYITHSLFMFWASYT